MANENKSIKISSLQMGSFYDYEIGNRNKLDIGKAVLDYSLFTEFMQDNKMIVNGMGKSYDFIMCKFDYGTDEITRGDIRDKYYKTGFTIDWDKYYSDLELDRISRIKDDKERSKEKNKFTSKSSKNKKVKPITYKMLMRSTGKAKEGDCIFINEDLFDVSYKYISMGITLPKDSNKVVEIAAYNTLTCANMISSVRIPLENILVLKDEEIATYANVVSVETKLNSHLEGDIDFKTMENEANEKGYTFYKKNEKIEDGFILIEDQKIDSIKILGIGIIRKSSGKKGKSLDFSAMERNANEKNHTFYKKNASYKYIENRKRSVLESLGIKIIEKESDKEIQPLDIKEMENEARQKGYTFFKKEAKKDGYELIPRTGISAEEKEIEIKFVPGTEVTVESNECYVERSESPVKVKENIMWDGMGVIDHSLIPSGCSGFIYLRNHMTKVCCFDGEVVLFLKDKYREDYETATTEDYFGNYINIKDVRLITTNNAIKWIGKFEEQMGENPYDFFKERLAECDYKFAVVKTAHKSKYGNLQRSSFQGNNSLPCLDEDDLTEIAKTSIDYCNKLKTDDDVFLKHLEITATNYNINKFLVELATKYPKIMKTKEFSKKRTSIISKFKRERLMMGKTLQKADNLTIAGNVYALLMKAAKEDWKSDPTLNKIEGAVQCYTTRFSNGEYLAGYRSPQNAPNNYGYYINHYSDLMKKYFPNLGDNVICINMIETANQSRLNGHDMDTDGIYCTNQLEIVKYAKLSYQEYPTIVNNIPLVPKNLTQDEKEKYGVTEYQNTLEGYALMDNNIAKFQYGIGNSSNVAQLALSYYFDKLARTGVKDKNLEDVYIICSCMAQCYIDSAKRTFMLDLNKEMQRLSNLSYMARSSDKYPKFYAKSKIAKSLIMPSDSEQKKINKKKAIEKIKELTIEDCKCPMDMLAKIIDDGVEDLTGKNKNGNLSIRDFMVKKDDIKVKNRHQKDSIEEIVKEYDNAMMQLDKLNEDYSEEVINITDETIRQLMKYDISRDNMYKLVRIAFGVESANSSKYFCDRILVLFYNYDKMKGTSRLMSLFTDSQKMAESA
jgi:hypothetical protein